MIGALINIILISTFCNGAYLLFNFGNLLNPIRNWYIDICAGVQNANGSINWTYGCNRYIHSKKIFFYKPLFGCITCMASIWGTVAYWTISPFTIHSLIMYPIIIVSCSCMNLLINRLYE